MPVQQDAAAVVTGFDNVPDFAKGLVRDMRVRWACEEIGMAYRTDLLDAFQPRPDSYREWQPFGQVPAFDDGEVRLFESGAILLYLGDQDERLLPREPQPRWQATAWLFAAVNSIEPALLTVQWLGVFNADKDWSAPALPIAMQLAEKRLQSLSDALGDNEWLTGRFTIADIMMVTVLRQVFPADTLGRFANLKAYRERGEARPAFRQAIADQMAGFAEAEEA